MTNGTRDRGRARHARVEKPHPEVQLPGDRKPEMIVEADISRPNKLGFNQSASPWMTSKQSRSYRRRRAATQQDDGFS